MAIHHAILKQAERMGFTLEENGWNGMVRAFMPSVAQQVFGVSAKDASNQMIAFQNIMSRDEAFRIQHVDGMPLSHGRLRNKDTGEVSSISGTPVELYRAIGNKDHIGWHDPEVEDATVTEQEDEVDTENVQHLQTFDQPEFQEDETPPNGGAAPLVKRSENGVPLDGATAYAEGIMAADNPFPEGSDEGATWDEQWDAAADEAPDPEEHKGGSVVSSKYRTIYKERGHPTHSGDWLAVLLNNYCVGKKDTDLAMAERIFNQNGVDVSKYNRTTNGWQGRIRMTGRNLLARVVHGKGSIDVPNPDNPTEWMTIQAPADWIAAQRFVAPKG